MGLGRTNYEFKSIWRNVFHPKIKTGLGTVNLKQLEQCEPEFGYVTSILTYAITINIYIILTFALIVVWQHFGSCKVAGGITVDFYRLEKEKRH